VNAALAEAGDAFLRVSADAPLIEVSAGPSAGCELRAAGRRTTWIVRLGDRHGCGSLDAFDAAFSGLAVREADDGTLVVEDPEYGTVRFLADARIVAEGRVLDPSAWSIRGEARRFTTHRTAKGQARCA
jgi:hypothetical protein